MILDFLYWLSGFVWVGIIFVLIPCAFFNKTRLFSAWGLLICSYFFGLYFWLIGFFITLSYWNLLVLIIGLLFFGIGVIPLAFIAIVINDGLLWALFFLLNIPIIWIFRIISFYLFGKVIEKKPEPNPSIIEGEDLKICEI